LHLRIKVYSLHSCIWNSVSTYRSLYTVHLYKQQCIHGSGLYTTAICRVVSTHHKGLYAVHMYLQRCIHVSGSIYCTAVNIAVYRRTRVCTLFTPASTACIHVSGSVSIYSTSLYPRIRGCTLYTQICIQQEVHLSVSVHCILYNVHWKLYIVYRGVSRISLYTAYTPMLKSGNQRITVSASELTVQ
jgi:hypothetical protein